MGCHVTTTCSAPNADLCKSLGADTVVDYKKENVLEALKASGHKFDHVVDNVGVNEDLIWKCHDFMQPKAVYILVGGEPSLSNLTETLKRKLWPAFLGGVRGKVLGFWPQPKTEDLQQIGQWIKDGKVKAVIDHKFPFEEAPKALAKLRTGRARGKIVVDVASDTFKRESA